MPVRVLFKREVLDAEALFEVPGGLPSIGNSLRPFSRFVESTSCAISFRS